MPEISRFYVEKKKGLDLDAAALLADIHESLGITGLKSLRVLCRYDIEGVKKEHLDSARGAVISEPPVDNLYEESFPLGESEVYFVTEYLPGQFDQCADSLIQCIQIISGESSVNASYALVYVLGGSLTAQEIDKIAQYCHNPVDSRIGKKEKPETLEIKSTTPADVKTLEFTGLSDSELESFKNEFGCAMSVDDLIFCREHFKNDEKRNPTVTELKVIDTYWSDHCRHTTFLTELTDIKIEDGFYSETINKAYNAYLSEKSALGRDKKPITLMDIATTGMRALKAKGFLEDLDESDEINACSVVIDVDVDGENQEWLLMFKNETHNHPTEIEPFGGAATCLGGAIRDPLSGRAYVYQAMRITGSGDPRTPVSQTISGKLPQRKITTEAARGYSSYGNQIGLATGHVREIYDEGFVAKRMELGAVIGAAPKQNVRREKPEAGDVVIIVGGRTGRDGCGGATGSSKEHSVDSINECGAEVQKGNAPTERKLQRLFRNEKAARLIKKCNDFGAGGVCVAIGELADSLKINLDAVLKKYAGLDGTEIAISESQERMAVVVSKENAGLFISLAQEENLEAVSAAEVTDDGYMRMLWRGKEIVSLSRSFLNTNGAKQEARAIIRNPEKFWQNDDTEQYNGDIKQAFINVMHDLNACSQKGLVERFDSTIGAGTVLMPFGGKNQLTPEDVMAAKIPVLNGYTSTTSVMSAAYDPAIFYQSPFHGGIYSVVESIARLVAAGCDCDKIRLSFQEYFEKLTDAYSWGKPAAALLGAFYAQMGLNAPSIGGKDSMSGTFGDLNVPPVLASFAVSTASAEKIKSAALNGEGNLYIIMPEYDRYNIVDFESLKAKYKWFYNNLEQIGVTAAAAVKKFGIAETAAKMCFGNGAGVKLDDGFIKKHGEKYLFLPFYGALVFEARGEISLQDMEKYNIELLGTVNKSGIISVSGAAISVCELISEWEKPLEKIFPTKSGTEGKAFSLKLYDGGAVVRKSSQPKKPLVFIPAFPGTNCEYDSANAFKDAGADVSTIVFRNLSQSDIEESVKKMAAEIRRSQIIMIPGGFSSGDEPNGSAKFISAVFRNPYITEAVCEHLAMRDGLILGICNGFQALIKLGLLPGGAISQITDTSPTIYYNEIGRHVSQLVDIKIISNKSPFLSTYKAGEIYKVPVSHGEGRFLADEEHFQALARNGQIATVYAGPDGNEAFARPFNPNGAMYGVEGLLSPDGRVFGRMGHPERKQKDIFKNVPGDYDTMIFSSAVNYYTI